MKILAFSDLHAHNFKAYATWKKGINSRLANTLDVLTQITEAARDVDLVLFLGDMFHVSPPPTNVLTRTYEGFLKLGATCKTWLIAGNHDMRTKQYTSEYEIPFYTFQQSSGSVGLQILRCGGYGFTQVNGQTILGISHASDERVREIIRGKIDKPEDTILLLHQEAYGAKDNFFTFQTGIKPQETAKFKWTLCGHLHVPQKLTERFIVLGAPLHIRFGDEGDRGFWILDTEKDDIEFVPTTFPHFISVGSPEEQKDDGNFYRVIGKKEDGEALELQDEKTAIDEYVKSKDAPESYADVGRALTTEIVKDHPTPKGWKLEQISLENFCSYRKQMITREPGLWLIAGINGSGKSSLWNALAWNLYGLTTKKEDDVLRRKSPRGAKCEVVVTLQRGADKLRVTRTKTKKTTSLVLNINGENLIGSKDDVQERLVSELGVSREFFNQMIYFSQETVAFFSSMGDADRKRLLGTIVGSKWYEDAQEIAKAKRAEAHTSLRTKQTEVTVAEGLLGVLRTEVTQVEQEIPKWVEQQAQVIKLLQEKKESAAKEVNELREKKAQLVAEVTFDEKRYEELLVQQGDVEKDTQVKQADLMVWAQKLQASKTMVTHHEEDRRGSQHSLRDYMQKRAAIENQEEGVRCPVCGSKISPDSKQHCLREIDSQIDVALVVLEQAKNSIAEEKEKQKAIEEQRQAIEHEMNVLKLQQPVIGYALDIMERKRNIKHAAEQEIENQEHRIREKAAECSEFEWQIRQKEQEKCPFDLQKQTLEESIREKNEQLKGLYVEEKELGTKVDMYAFWEKGFGREGIPGVMLEGFCKAFTREANAAYSHLQTNLQVDLSSRTQLKSGEYRDRLSYKILTPTGESSYKSLSGGEKTRVDLISMLALNQIASRQFGIQNGLLGILILDEVFSSLDEAGCDLVYDILSEFQADSVFVITHDASLKSMFDRTMIVTKKGDISVLEMG